MRSISSEITLKTYYNQCFIKICYLQLFIQILYRLEEKKYSENHFPEFRSQDTPKPGFLNGAERVGSYFSVILFLSRIKLHLFWILVKIGNFTKKLDSRKKNLFGVCDFFRFLCVWGALRTCSTINGCIILHFDHLPVNFFRKFPLFWFTLFPMFPIGNTQNIQLFPIGDSIDWSISDQQSKIRTK